LEINPSHFQANARLGWLYREDGRLDEAGNLLRQALALRPGDPVVLYYLGQVMQALGKTDEALRLIERSVETLPDSIPAQVLLARLYFRLNRPAVGRRVKSTIERLTTARQKRSSPTSIPLLK